MASVTLTLKVDSAQAVAELAELIRLHRASPAWLQCLASQALDGVESGIELTQIDFDHLAAARAGETWIGAKLSERHRGVLAALRAAHGDREACVLFEREVDLHGGAHG